MERTYRLELISRAPIRYQVRDDLYRASRTYDFLDATAVRDWLIDRANGYPLSPKAEARIHAAG